MNVEGARLARQAADEVGGRFVAGLARAAQRHALALPEGRRPVVPRGHLRPGRRRRTPSRSAASREGGVDLLLIETIFDTLNAKAAIAAARDVAPRAAALDLGHDRRPLRPDALRPDGRGVLELDRARQAADRRRQLLARRQGDAAARGRARRGSPTRTRAPTRTPACRTRSAATTSSRTTPPSCSREFAERRLRQHRRRLLRHDARPHRAIAAAVDGQAPRTGPEAPARPAVQRPRAVRDRAGHRLRDDRRAHERDRLGALPPADRGGRPPGRGRRRARAGARRREPARREHGRRPARQRAGDDDVPQPDRDRARGGPDPDHGRQLALLGARGRAEVRAGQGHRQLDQPQGGRGVVPRAGPADPPLRRRRRRDGLRRAGPGGHRRAQGRDLRPRVRPARRRRLGARGHRLRPERARGRDRHRGAQRLRQGVHRGAAADQGALPGLADQRRHLQPLVLVPRQRRRPRGDALGLPLPRDPGRPGHGHRQRRPARRLRGHPGRPARARRGRALRPAPRRHRPAGRVRRDGAGRRRRSASSTSPGARRRSRSGSRTRSCTAIVDFIEEDTEEARQQPRGRST